MFERSAEYAKKASGLKSGLSPRHKTQLKELLKKIEGGKVAAQASCMSLDVDAMIDDFKAMSAKGKEKRVSSFVSYFVAAISTCQKLTSS